MSKLTIGVLASGRGSNLQAILDNIAADRLHVRIGAVICDQPNAYALQRAKAAGIPAFEILRSSYGSKAEFESAIIACLNSHEVDFVVLAGYMRIVSAAFVQKFSNRILNIHPALLPSFTGLHAQQQAIDYGAKISGCTVHFVDEGMDTGPIIAQRAVKVEAEDTADTLADRILVQEHLLYSEVIEMLAQGRIKVEGRKVALLD